MAACDRERLPNRRLAETFGFPCNELPYTCTAGRFADGRIGEIFLTNGKSGSDADTSARDAAIAASFALQHGSTIDEIRHALCRDSNGKAIGPLGVALDLLSDQSNSPR